MVLKIVQEGPSEEMVTCRRKMRKHVVAVMMSAGSVTRRKELKQVDDSLPRSRNRLMITLILEIPRMQGPSLAMHQTISSPL
jgi:hypothetical protein